MVVHFAWFRRDSGEWLAEWIGDVPAQALDPTIIGDERTRELNAWQQKLQPRIIAGDFAGVGVADEDGWIACPSQGAVCLDVSRFDWPLGDHQYHQWNDATQLLDWPASSARQYIELQNDSLDVVANVESHRPIRNQVPGQTVIDITGSPLAQYHGNIWGRFVRLDDRWTFQPCSRRRDGQRIAPPSVRRALAAASIDFLEYLEQLQPAGATVTR